MRVEDQQKHGLVFFGDSELGEHGGITTNGDRKKWKFEEILTMGGDRKKQVIDLTASDD